MHILQKYRPQNAIIVPWNKIEEHYDDLISYGWRGEPILSLVKFIQTENLDKRLFAYTSMDMLIITIYNPAEWNREALHIEFNNYSRRWHFEYFPKPNEPTEMERYYPEELGITKFCQFIEMLRW